MASKAKKSRSRSTKKANNSILWLVGAGVLILIAIPIVVTLIQNRNLPGEFYRSQGNIHIDIGDNHPEYNSNPPTSGWHTGDLTGWGSYDYIVPDQRVIHNMEDGGVIIWYQMGTAEENKAEIIKLEEISKGYRRVVIMPRENMPTPYAMTAWTRLERFESLDEAGMRAFLEAYEGIDHHVAGTG
ncbi:MAG: DUF3105 domain-containing protein [Trueperaceae bacterium]|nr:DUF3105 domain-containing protein [Trueperaceae bacterium]